MARRSGRLEANLGSGWVPVTSAGRVRSTVRSRGPAKPRSVESRRTAQLRELKAATRSMSRSRSTRGAKGRRTATSCSSGDAIAKRAPAKRPVAALGAVRKRPAASSTMPDKLPAASSTVPDELDVDESKRSESSSDSSSSSDTSEAKEVMKPSECDSDSECELSDVDESKYQDGLFMNEGEPADIAEILGDASMWSDHDSDLSPAQGAAERLRKSLWGEGLVVRHFSLSALT